MLRTLPLYMAIIVLTGYSSAERSNAEVGQDRGVSANGAMVDFGRDNPKCQLWTDWRLMCSRSGDEAGETVCVTDPGRQVEPSAPFCTDSYLGYDAANLNAAQTQSVLRFCEVVADMEIPEVRDGERIMTPIKLCQKFQKDRPFNGRRVAARLHPWCDEWSDSENRSVVCTVPSGESGRTSSCNALAAEGYAHNTRLYCSKWKLPDWCHQGRGFYDFVRGRPAPTDDAQDYSDVIYFGSQPPTAAPIYGVQCSSTKEAFEELE